MKINVKTEFESYNEVLGFLEEIGLDKSDILTKFDYNTIRELVVDNDSNIEYLFGNIYILTKTINEISKDYIVLRVANTYFSKQADAHITDFYLINITNILLDCGNSYLKNNDSVDDVRYISNDIKLLYKCETLFKKINIDIERVDNHELIMTFHYCNNHYDNHSIYRRINITTDSLKASFKSYIVDYMFKDTDVNERKFIKEYENCEDGNDENDVEISIDEMIDCIYNKIVNDEETKNTVKIINDDNLSKDSKDKIKEIYTKFK